MTCIIALASSSALYLATGKEGEVWEVSKAGRTWLVGVVGDPRYRQVFRYLLKWPESGSAGFGHETSEEEQSDAFVYLVAGLVPKLIRALEEHHLLVKAKEGGASMKARLIITTDDRLFEIDNRFAVHEEVDELFAGIGEHYGRALGSLFMTADSEMKPEERLKVALEAALAKGFYMIQRAYE